MINSKNLTVTILAILISLPLLSQKSLGLQQPERVFEKAMELYRLKKYGSARDQFDKIIRQSVRGESNQYAQACYYQAVCAKNLENGDAEYLFEKFIADFPESNRRSYAYFHLGDMKLTNRKYRQALRKFEEVKESKLDEETRYAFMFKKGYCHFMEEDYDVANRYFYDLKDIDNKYYDASNYYYSHIQYQKGNYNTALEGFERLKDVPAFRKLVPFYISQIYYLKGDFDEAIQYALPLIEDGSKERKADMARIVGESYFAKKNYAQSTNYFESTIKLSSKAKREDYYHLGFAYYYQKKYDKAAEYLSMVTSANDEMAQNAYYHLADCHMRLKDKKRARVAFEAASKYDFDKDIQEDALFNTIKLNYELNYSPFNEIINSFLDFIDKFPESDKIDLAYDYLGKVFLTTKNYAQALEALENIKIKNSRVYEAMQKVAYYRAIDLFTNLSFSDAVKYFNYSLDYGKYNKELKVKSYYWRGEAKYRLGMYSQAVEDYNTFILTPGSFGTDYFALAHYNIAYAEFKDKNYELAKSWWRKYINIEKNNGEATVGDAYNRIGDCYFVQRDFQQAISYYEKATGRINASPDYSIYQKAISLGILKKHETKISELNGLINKYPKSHYVDDALYEMGKSYVAMGDLPNAIRKYKTIKEKYSTSSYSKKAMLQLGLVYYNSNDYDNSMQFYKRVVNEFPGTQEAMESLLGIRNIYMDRNDLDGYVGYTKTLGSFAQVDVREQDSLSYVSAERYYMDGKCDPAVKSFQTYLNRYPQGMFALNANYYMADCLYKKGEKYDALRAYKEVTNKGKNIFTEDALIRSGEINFGMEKYNDALSAFEQLEQIAEIKENRMEARIGVMRCNYKLNNADKTIESAITVMNSPKVAEEIIREARYYKAGAHLVRGEQELAMKEYTVLSKNPQSVQGAEAKYLLAQNYYDNGNKEKAEDEVFDLANKGTSHQYWLARCFILLSDIYISNQEFFQAKQYLQSIVENYKGEDDIKGMVQQRLKVVEEKMAVTSAKESVDTLKIQ
ncbi:tetratricopeptide repeat protein [Plebeiibacterium marinum]|uniref:Tetratricopeptide repeat protein n=1 Tax=Plebeiibacterium marinum TaxID=2992111 RepID=A0AAE3MHB4_9BACT|nr:tetratricopeptide repeat protein [Plebeiobacterium marinum]MCW3807606.1 tetratricopeptide repeat protein [Plebeiobacterium marinum]